MASMKRSREDGVTGSLDMAKCLTLLSTELDTKRKRRSHNRDAFECKTCHREFASFQALGGHRASHKRPRPVVPDDKMDAKLVGKPKMHECTICGLEFAMGQALGGHMRRHRALLMGESFPEFRLVHGHDHRLEEAAPVVPVLRRSSSSCGRRVFGMDLNLTPLENDLAVLFGKMAPKVDVFV